MARKADTLCNGGCGKLLFTGRSSRTAPVCQGCRKSGAYRAQKPVRPPRVVNARIGRSCQVCGATYNATHAPQRTCSRECGAWLQNSGPGRPGRFTPIYYGTCRECARSFVSPRSRVFCSDSCEGQRVQITSREWAAYNARRVEGAEARRILEAERAAKALLCPCGAALPSARRQRCDECRDRSEREGIRRRRRARKARLLGVESSPYTVADILTRDGIGCWLCPLPMDMTLRVPARLAPTVDHVVPLARSGPDTLENVRMAHFICNSLKSDKILE
jgi:hypothetical protein